MYDESVIVTLGASQHPLINPLQYHPLESLAPLDMRVVEVPHCRASSKNSTSTDLLLPALFSVYSRLRAS